MHVVSLISELLIVDSSEWVGGSGLHLSLENVKQSTTVLSLSCFSLSPFNLFVFLAMVDAAKIETPLGEVRKLKLESFLTSPKRR